MFQVYVRKPVIRKFTIVTPPTKNSYLPVKNWTCPASS